VIGRRLFLLGAAGLLACQKHELATGTRGTRIVTLAPAVTETLFAIGAGGDVVAVSDYCDSPPEVQKLPRVGTSITPNYEAIARVAPTLIVSESNAATRARELGALAPTRLLPWLALSEITASIRELGRLSRQTAAADALATRLQARLDVPEPAAGPRVLLVLGSDSESAAELWFIRKNSLHGAALHASGARNAVPEAVSGPPRLAAERLFTLDPDAIVILSRPGGKRTASAPLVASLERFHGLRVVAERRVSVLVAPEAFANGPRILTLVDRLEAELRRLGLRK